MAESEDIEILKRRGRRRLLGAIALVLLAVIVLPMVFDQEPKGTSLPVDVRIPGEDAAAPFAPKGAPPSAPQASPSPKEPAAVVPSKPDVKAEGAKTAKGEDATAAPHAPQSAPQEEKKSVATAAPAAPRAVDTKAAAKQEFIVPVVALANRDKLKAVTDRLKKAKLPYYTERVATAKGTVTRVRVGPYDRRESAERALKRLKELGFTPGAITTRSG